MSLSKRLINTGGESGLDYSNLDISQATANQLLYNQDPSARGNHMGIAPNGLSIVWSGNDLSYVKALGQSFLSVPTDILSYNTGIYTSATNVVDISNGYRNVQFADNGYVLYFSDLNVLTVVYLANPYDVSSYTSFNKYTIDGNRSAFFSQDGSIMYLKHYVSYTTDSKIYQYSTSNFVYSTANLVGEFSTDGIFGASFQQRTAMITPDGRKIICVGTGADRLDQLDLSTPFDITTASFNNKTLSTTNMYRDPSNVSFSLDGTIMYVGSSFGLASYNITL